MKKFLAYLVFMTVAVAFIGVAAVWTYGLPRSAYQVFGLPAFAAANYGAKDGLEIAKYDAEKAGSMHLLCTNDGKRLLVRTALQDDILRAGAEGQAHIYVRGIEHKILTRMKLTSREGFDTLISDTLLPADLENLASYFGTSTPEKVSIMTMETGTFLAGSVTGDAITAFDASCR